MAINNSVVDNRVDKENKANEYTWRNKLYVAVRELSKGSCVGCCFHDLLNCALYEDRVKLCLSGKIFMRKLGLK